MKTLHTLARKGMKNKTSWTPKGEPGPDAPAGKGRVVSRKDTGKWIELKNTFLNEFTGRFRKEMAELEGKEFVDAYLKFIEFFKPRMQRLEVKGEIEHQPVIHIVRAPANGTLTGKGVPLNEGVALEIPGIVDVEADEPGAPRPPGPGDSS